jgi:formylglycine-generating enzyme
MKLVATPKARGRIATFALFILSELIAASLASCEMDPLCSETATCPPIEFDAGSEIANDGSDRDRAHVDASEEGARPPTTRDGSISDVGNALDGLIILDRMGDRTETGGTDSGIDAAGNGGAGGNSGAGGSAGADSSGGAAGASGGAGASSGNGGSGGSSDGDASGGTGGRSGTDASDTGGSIGADASDGTGGSSGSSGSDSGRGVNPSCAGLAAMCGPNGNADCCASSTVFGGIYNRGNDANYPATISDFRLDAYEITVGRFRKFVAAYSQSMIPSGAGKNLNNANDTGWDASWNAILPADATALTSAGPIGVQCNTTYQTWTPSAAGNESRPMNCLTWYEAEAFCIWDGGRLPTEAEWNYAAAGGSEQRQYPWGSLIPSADANLAAYACYYNSTGACSGTTNIAIVGSIPAGNGRWGQADLAGNIFEWVQDWYANPYPPGACNDCANLTSATYRVFRGGSFLNAASSLLSSFRDPVAPSSRNSNVGARCARTP